MNDRTQDYVFVSYSHKDDIQPLLQAFAQRRYNLVYDEAMSYGEEWDLKARRYIQNPKCKGVLSLLSRYSLYSKPVLKETEYAERFKKNLFAVLLENQPLAETYARLSPTLNEDQQYVLDEMMESFPPEQLYTFANGINWDKVAQTFATWGFAPTLENRYDQLTQVTYSSDIVGEDKRLHRQQESYYDLDMQVIGRMLDKLGKNNVTVLDIGCGNGDTSLSRFGDDPRIAKVIGVDYHPRSIEEARRKAASYGDRFAFYEVDLNASDAIDRIRAAMAEQGVEKIDLVFAALVLHHLENPQLLLLKLYDVFDERGKIIVRGSDDGGKLCYPQSELLTEILDRYGRLTSSSDRENGRKLYSQLYHAGYINPQMKYVVSDTTDADKDMLFHLAFGFRLNRIDALVAKNPDNAFLLQEREWMANALARFKEAFFRQDFWYCVTTYIASAEVGE